MKKLTKILSAILIFCYVIVISFSFVSCSDSEVKNLIYIIGDGMGINHIENTKIFSEREKFVFEDFYVGDVTTHSADNEITDSSAAATALATGVKTSNKLVGIDPNGKELQNIMELSHQKGKKTAIVTTDDLSGGTPAGFSAHVTRRTDEFGIAEDQAEGNIDLLLGNYNSAYTNYKKYFVNNGFSYAESMEELQNLTSGERIIGNIKNVDSVYNPELTDVVSLKDMVEFALNYLTESSQNGFTLMVEGAYIDKHSHNRDIKLMMYAMLDLNDAVEYIFDWAKERTDTAIIFTADHETGGLQKANSIEAVAGSLYTSSKHTSTNVPLYLYNVTTKLTLHDNTDVYKIAKKVVKA